MPFYIVREDITRLKVCAIVNAANTDLKMGGGVSAAIFKLAGVRQLSAACDKLAPIKIGEAVVTPGFNLPAKYIIHAAGPVYQPGHYYESGQLLRSTYLNALQKAVDLKCESVAFPLISSGLYGYPKEEALRVGTSAIEEFLKTYPDLEVTMVVFDQSALAVSRKLLFMVKSYIDDHYVFARHEKRRRLLGAERQALKEAQKESPRPEAFLEETRFSRDFVSEKSYGLAQEAATPLEELIENLDESFSQTVLRLIDKKGFSDVEVYTRANLSRQLFSTIRTRQDYRPSKQTAVALALALKLNLKESTDLLKRAGLALSHADKFDVIIEYFILNNHYDIFTINEVLFEHDQLLLGK